MRSGRSKLFLLSLIVGGVLLSPPVFAADEQAGAEQMRSDISDIKTRLAALDQQQKEILAKEDKILEELDRVRIWVHKR